MLKIAKNELAMCTNNFKLNIEEDKDLCYNFTQELRRTNERLHELRLMNELLHKQRRMNERLQNNNYYLRKALERSHDIYVREKNAHHHTRKKAQETKSNFAEVTSVLRQDIHGLEDALECEEHVAVQRKDTIVSLVRANHGLHDDLTTVQQKLRTLADTDFVPDIIHSLHELANYVETQAISIDWDTDSESTGSIESEHDNIIIPPIRMILSQVQENVSPPQDTSCSICLDHFNKNKKATKLPCGHFIHDHCCTMHFALSSNFLQCPICRHDIVSSDSQYDNNSDKSMLLVVVAERS